MFMFLLDQLCKALILLYIESDVYVFFFSKFFFPQFFKLIMGLLA